MKTDLTRVAFVCALQTTIGVLMAFLGQITLETAAASFYFSWLMFLGVLVTAKRTNK